MTPPRSLQVGDQMPAHVQGPITRATLALFAGASHDHVPLHIDSDYCQAAGIDDVFAHGMLSMAYLAQAITGWAGRENLRGWNVRFTAITPLHATVRCGGEVVEILHEGDERLARLKVGAWTEKNVQTLDGEALVALDA